MTRAGSDDRVVRTGWAVDEVPRAQGPFLTLDDQQCLAGEDEEILLVGFPVVHRHRLARAEPGQVDPELQEVSGTLDLGAFELAQNASSLSLPPVRVAGIEDEPAVAPRHETVLGRNELRLGFIRRRGREPAPLPSAPA